MGAELISLSNSFRPAMGSRATTMRIAKRVPVLVGISVLVIASLALMVAGAVRQSSHMKPIASPEPEPTSTVIAPGVPAMMDSTGPSEPDWAAPSLPQTYVPFEPRGLSIETLGSFDIQSLPRVTTADGRVASPDPLNDDGTSFAWDNESHQVLGDGNTLLTAHTRRDQPSALGNRLIDELHVGDEIRASGLGAESATFVVTERIDVPVSEYPLHRVYIDDSVSQIIITVCSNWDGAQWADRTVWFATA